MRKALFILLMFLTVAMTAVAHASDTIYTEKAAMEAYATNPDRALLIIDSAEIVGNLTDVRADLLRAVVCSRTYEDIKLDSAIMIGERLIQNDKVLTDPEMQEEVLEILLNACRLKKDNEQALHWATQLSDLYRQRGELTEAMRTDAEIGTFLVRIGQQEEGLSLIDNIAAQLTGGGITKFNELDALIIVLKRKVEICNEIGLYGDMIPAAQRMLDLLNDYEKYPEDYHDGSNREPDAADRPDYIDFYRGKAYAYFAIAYSSLESTDAKQKASIYLALYEQTIAGQSVTGRFLITPTLRKLGKYDRVLSIYDEVERQLGNDTLNVNYLEILLGRAEIADAQGRYREAYNYGKRHNELSTLLNERLLQGKAHLYAARYKAQEQQMEIERQREATRRAKMTISTMGIVGLLILLFAIYVLLQWQQTKRRNRILAQQITEAVEYKEKYRELSAQNSKLQNNSKLYTLNSQLSDAELFVYLRDLIEREQLFLNQNFERQTLITLTGLSKERIGAAFSQGSDYERLTTLIRELRLDHAVRLLNEHPEMSIEQICQASGFANTVSFNRSFKAQYGMTPTDFRGTK
ncbi:MAG: AraC family transcriptional regulator [Bacteroidales bacterium]|nr:AraC family transcriptional regulator [Bacteroidales bacterium]